MAQELELDPRAAGEDAIAPLARLAELRLRHGRIEEAERPRSRRSSTLGAACRADEAAALVLSLGGYGRSAARAEPLSRREQEVLALRAEGPTNAEIAARLVISEKTAGHHVSRVYRKLDLRNRVEAAAYALRHRATPFADP